MLGGMGAVRWVDAGRGIAMLMVVAGHTIDWTRADEVDPVVKVSLSLIVSCSLPLFFFISGVLATGVPHTSWRTLMARKVAPLLWVFLLWQPVVFTYKLAAEASLPGQAPADLSAALLRLLASPLRPTGELWFIWALAVFYVLTRALRGVPVRVQVAAAVALSAVWVTVAPALVSEDILAVIGVGWNGLVSYAAFFALGLALPNARARVASLSLTTAVVVAGLWITAVSVLSVVGLTATPILAFVVKLSGLAGGVCLARLAQSWGFLRRVGRATMPLYLMHTTVIVLVLVAATTTGIAPVPWSGTGAILLWAIAVSVGLVFGWMVDVADATWLTRTVPARLRQMLRLPEQHVPLRFRGEAERTRR